MDTVDPVDTVDTVDPVDPEDTVDPVDPVDTVDPEDTVGPARYGYAVVRVFVSSKVSCCPLMFAFCYLLKRIRAKILSQV